MEPIKLADVSPSELNEHYEWYTESLGDTGEIPLSYDEYVREIKDNLTFILSCSSTRA